MKPDFASRFAGGAFITAALMLWLGWWLLPVRIGTFFDAEVFGRINDQFHYWIWMYRIHIFGMITTVIALVAVAALVADSPARVLIWPGAVVASAGMVVSALGAAFYYHHGAWGALDLAGRAPLAALAFVETLRVDTEYVTCLVRFGRVFGGLGLAVLGWGLVHWSILPAWSGIGAAAVGVCAMALTMALPDHLSYYLPVFHVMVLWMLATGTVICTRGVRVPAAPAAKPVAATGFGAKQST
ncbi:MAG: hypothetical protein ACREIA_13310 [Opitutaceae bacterium]